ncbi:MAG: 30S ribosomal protein S17e [Candidatus Woesearchaeota archaeon]
MGRIKTKLVKRITREIMEVASDRITEDFTQNKAIVAELTNAQSKKFTNIVAGYATRLKKAQEVI